MASNFDDTDVSEMFKTSSTSDIPQPAPPPPPAASPPPPMASFDSPMASFDSPSTPIVMRDDPFAVITNNAPGFKYKYPQAAPTPDNEDDVVWNKVYTAADSRMYNKHGKSATESRKFRESGETRVLAIRMLAENKAKHAAGIPPRAKAVKRDTPLAIKKETSRPRGSTPLYSPLPFDAMMSISEKIKSEGRARKPTAAAATAAAGSSSNQGTPAPVTQPGLSQAENAMPSVEVKKAPPKKRPAPTGAKKFPSKKPKTTQGGLQTGLDRLVTAQKLNHTEPNPIPTHTNRASHTPAPRQGSESSGDGNVYCICRGPDDHRMMVSCEGGCEEWYHCSCVAINEDDAKKLLDRFICPKCTTPERFTTYRRLCRNFNIKDDYGEPACREPARVTSEPPSKYCSEKCKNDFFKHIKSRLRQNDTPSVGGALNKYEVARILQEKKTIGEIQKLGQKPRLQKEDGLDPKRPPVGMEYLTAEEKQKIEEIEQKQSTLEARIRIYKQQHMLLKMIVQRASTAAQQPGVDVKDPCGYDSRLSMNEEEFKLWASSDEGRTAFTNNVIGNQSAFTMELLSRAPYPGQSVPETILMSAIPQNICLRPKKKCKHQNWLKIHNDEFLSMQKRLGEEMERLGRERGEIIDDAETREAMRPYYKGNTVMQLF